MLVLKFGGSSVADAASMSRCVEIIKEAVSSDRVIVVGSAIGGCTDELICIGNLAAAGDPSYKDRIEALQARHAAIVRQVLHGQKAEEDLHQLDLVFTYLDDIARGVCLLGELSDTSLDAIQGSGELLSTRIIAAMTAAVGIPTRWADSRDIIRLRNDRGKKVVDMDLTCSNVRALIEGNPTKQLFVVPGFIASDEKGRMATLGRGGSDYSASLFAVGSKARALQTWKDVPGMMTANPQIVPQARPISHISYRAALELSHFGAKVIYPPTIQPVVADRIPIYVKCTFDPSAEGTLIEQNPPRSPGKLIGISNSDNIALISLEGSGMVGVPGFTTRLFQTLSENDISVILITQASSVNTMCIAVAEKDAAKAKEATDLCFAYEISLGKLNPLKVETGYSIVCLVGDDIISQRGTTGRMLDALGRKGIGVRAVAQGSSERNISVILSSSDAPEAIRYIHEEFFETSHHQEINLFIAGYGTVGRELVKMIGLNADAIASRSGRRLNIVGVSNSRRYVINREGLDPGQIGELLQNGESAASDAFFEQLSTMSLQNSIFVDCTASDDISYKYLNLFRAGYSVVACNKIPFAGTYSSWQDLHRAAAENRVRLRYETTVGAALPILESLARSLNSGDRLEEVTAVLSGSVSYILNEYDGSRPFAEIVSEAKAKGYTEPDPEIDLRGRDVLRKLLILSREAGIPLEESQVQMQNVFGEDIYAEHPALLEARGKGLRNRFVAHLQVRPDGGILAEIGCIAVGPDSPLYALEGTDNEAIIKTSFYRSPLIIGGAGAGPEKTASGLLNDILLSF